jgi:hypothetical protein
MRQMAQSQAILDLGFLILDWVSKSKIQNPKSKISKSRGGST